MRHTLNYENEVKLVKEQQKKGFKLQFFILIILFLIPMFSFFRDAGASAFRWEETQLTLNYPDGSSQVLPYGDIIDIEYRDSFDFGTPATGSTVDQCKYGLWHNEEFGDYQACCHIDIPGCIIFTTADTHFVISFESSETTLTLYDSLVETLTNEGYLDP